MSGDGTTPEDGGDGTDTAGDLEYRAIVEQYENRADQCTIYPTGSGEFERATTWVTALDGSYVALLNCR